VSDPTLLAGVTCPVVLGAGEHDGLVRTDLAVYVDQPRIAPDRGHNVQVEDPEWVISQILSVTR
jgi:pimeloyl-ACP methyl ester carboxylesterase